MVMMMMRTTSRTIEREQEYCILMHFYIELLGLAYFPYSF